MTCSVGAADAGNVGARRAIDKGQAVSACRRALSRATYRALLCAGASPTVRSNCPSAFVPLAARRPQQLGCRPPLKISFNLFAKQFHDQGIVKDVRNIFLNSAIQFSQVVFELSEFESIENFALGVRIAIDDVGTGHSGLSHMLELGVDIIKIDKMFVDAIGTDRNSTTIVETLAGLAHDKRMDVVAESVGNFTQVLPLRGSASRRRKARVPATCAGDRSGARGRS